MFLFLKAFQYNTTVKTQIARISYGKENSNQISSRSSLKDMDTRYKSEKPAKVKEFSPSVQLIENFAKKKQEREQEIKEIQEMLNEIKSPQKTGSQNSEDSNRKLTAETTMNGTLDKEVLKKAINESDNIKTRGTHPTATEQSKVSTTPTPNHQAMLTKTINPTKTTSYRRSNTEVQLTRPSADHQDNISGRISRRDTTIRSTTTIANKPRSKSVQLPLSAKDTTGHSRKVGYNPEKARQYMEMQKKQRKSQFLNEPANKAKIEKEEIKKRLEELKKNTRKLVNKNLQKKEKIASKNSPKQKDNLKPPETKVEEKIEVTKVLANDLKVQQFPSKTFITNKSETERAIKNQKMLETPGRSAQSLKSFSETTAFPLFENQKRIGLLRKTDNDKDFSFNSHKKHNFDKENQNLEILTRHLTQSKEKINSDKLSNKDKQKRSENSFKETEIQCNVMLEETNDKRVTETNIPENNLESNKKDNTPLDKLISKEIPKKQTQKETLDMPYWLRPSAAQVYPYNFIMAVRRKLEAIAQPLENRNMQVKYNQQTSTSDLNQHLGPEKRESHELSDETLRKKTKRRRDDGENQEKNKESKSLNENSDLKHLKPSPETKDIIEYKTLEKVSNAEISFGNKKEEKLSPVGDVTHSLALVNNKEQSQQPLQKHNKTVTKWTNIENPVLSKPLTQPANQNSTQLKQTSNCKSMESINSEIASDLSSISLQLPLSNTLTEVSSLRTESRRTFIHSSKLHIENSADDATSLTSGAFSSPEKNQHKLKTKEFEFVKPRPVSPLSLEKVEKLKIKRKVSNSDNEKIDGEKDFTLLLEDFNRSLSQVIQVNEQLKSTLDKSQQILSPHSSRKSSDTEKQYTSDFEKSTSQLEHTSADEEKLQKPIKKNNENHEQRKRQLFEMAEKVKPVREQQKETKNVEAVIAKVNGNPLCEMNFNIDLKSISNSSQTSTDKKTLSTGREENYSPGELVSLASKGYEKRLNEIETLKETLKQTILESKQKRRQREEECHKRNASETEKTHTETTQSNNKLQLKQTLQNSKDTQSDVETNKTIEKSHKENSMKAPYSHKELNPLEKYQKQYKSNLKELNRMTLNSGNYEPLLKFQDKVKQKSADSSNLSYSETYLSDRKEQQKTFAKTSDRSSGSQTNVSTHRSQEHTKSLNSKSTSRNLKINQNITGSYSSAQSEVDSVTTRCSNNSTNSAKRKLAGNSEDEPITSSIVEALQNTYESTARENESVPLNEKSKLKTDNSENKSKGFIKDHINRSRGDFQEITSNETHRNETQFQQAIQVSSHISSTELAQSADDEITSSAVSKAYNKVDSNLAFSYKALTVNKIQQNVITTTSPSKSNRRISIGSDIVKFFTQYDYERNQMNETSMSESSLNYSNVGLVSHFIKIYMYIVYKQ